jgi:hypothetical protein
VLKERGHVTYDFGLVLSDASYLKGEEPPVPKWLHELLGVDFFATVRFVNLDCYEIIDLAPLKNLPGLEGLALNNSVHDGTDLTPIMSLGRLKELHLNYTGLKPAQLEPILAANPNLQIASATHPELNH